jgi:hypothetical protein
MVSECGLQTYSVLVVLPRCEQLKQLVLCRNPGFDDELLSQIDRWNHTTFPAFSNILLRCCILQKDCGVRLVVVCLSMSCNLTLCWLCYLGVSN